MWRETKKLNHTYMSPQRKGQIKAKFKKSYSDLVEKLKLIPNSDKIRIVCMNAKLGKNECIICYDFKKEKFTQIKVIEEIIEL
jgi:hypothetical protein